MRRIDRCRSAKLACATLCLLCATHHFGTNARAQAQRSDNAQAPGQSYLTGDWDGVRPGLERLGVTITLNYTNDFLANASGGIKSGTVGIGIFQPQIDLDLHKLLGWQETKSISTGFSPMVRSLVFQRLVTSWPYRISRQERSRGSTRSGTST